MSKKEIARILEEIATLLELISAANPLLGCGRIATLRARC